jgi:hypothetical protein
LPDTENDAPDAEQHQAHQRRAALQIRQQIPQPTNERAAETKHHHFFRAEHIGVTSGMWTTDKGGEVLQANNQPSPEGAVAQRFMDIAGQNRQRQTYREVTCEVEDNDGENPQIKT